MTVPSGPAAPRRAPVLPMNDRIRRLPRLFAGVACFGFGLGLFFIGGNGVPGWDVFHQGIAERTPLSVGTVIIVVGVALLGVMRLLHEPIGIGTAVAALFTGVFVDITLWALDEPGSRWLGAAATLVGPLVVAVGTGLYLGVRLGSGPRDGLMTALERRGYTLWKARLGMELGVLVVGIALGGTFGWGTVWFAVTVGPAVQFALTRLSAPMHPSEIVAAAT